MTIAAIDGWFCRVPVRIIEETSYPISRSKKANFLVHILGRLATEVIAVSCPTKQFLAENSHIKKDKISVISNGVKDPVTLNEEEKLLVRSNSGILPADIVIGSVGRMENDVKGFDILLNGIAPLLKERPDIKLLLIGGGPLENDYKKLADHLGINQQCIFTGYTSDVHKFYQIMDLYLTFPRSEGFGMHVAEAISHGIPVLTNGTGGIKDIIDDGINGIIIKEHFLNDISSCLLYTSPSPRD